MLPPSFSGTSALVAVIQHKSFTKAAEQLGLSPARVSELVRNLEERIGVRLVERTTRSVAATAAGERLLERLRPALDEYQAAFDALNDFRAKPAGTLRLTVAPPAAQFVLGPVAARFLEQYPEINLDLAIENRLADIVEERYDAGIRQGERIARDMIAIRLSDPMPIVLAASPAYLASRGTPKAPDELPRHTCMRFRRPNGAIVPWRFAKKRNPFEVEVEGRITTNEPGVAVQAALDGAGLIQLPQGYVASELAAGRLVTVLDDWAPPAIDGFFLYYSSRRQMRAPLKALVGFLRATYRERDLGRTGSALKVRDHAGRQKKEAEGR